MTRDTLLVARLPIKLRFLVSTPIAQRPAHDLLFACCAEGEVLGGEYKKISDSRLVFASFDSRTTPFVARTGVENCRIPTNRSRSNFDHVGESGKFALYVVVPPQPPASVPRPCAPGPALTAHDDRCAIGNSSQIWSPARGVYRFAHMRDGEVGRAAAQPP